MDLFFSMISDYSFIFVLCIIIVIGSVIMFIIKGILNPKRNQNNYDFYNEDNNNHDFGLMDIADDIHNVFNEDTNDDTRFYKEPDLTYNGPKNIDDNTLKNLINHLDERINECNDEKQLEILMRKRDEYQRRLDKNI